MSAAIDITRLGRSLAFQLKQSLPTVRLQPQLKEQGLQVRRECIRGRQGFNRESVPSQKLDQFGRMEHVTLVPRRRVVVGREIPCRDDVHHARHGEIAERCQVPVQRPPKRHHACQEDATRAENSAAGRCRLVAALEYIAERTAVRDDDVETGGGQGAEIANVQFQVPFDAGTESLFGTVTSIQLELHLRDVRHDDPAAQSVQSLGEAPRTGADIQHARAWLYESFEEMVVDVLVNGTESEAIEPMPFVLAVLIEVRFNGPGLVGQEGGCLTECAQEAAIQCERDDAVVSTGVTSICEPLPRTVTRTRSLPAGGRLSNTTSNRLPTRR